MFNRTFIQLPSLTLAVLAVGTVATASPLPGPIPTVRRVVPGPNLIATPTGSSFSGVKLPSITGAAISGTSHVISIAGNGMSLTNIAISLPQQMENFSGITIQDQSGATVPAQIQRQDDLVTINFDAPVPAGSSLKVALNNVRMLTKGGERLPYSVSVMQTGAKGEISIGTALISVPTRD